MDDHASETKHAGAYDRREVLRRGAFVVGAATLWTTPVVQSLGMRPAAAGTGDDPDPTGSLCPPGSEESAQPRDLVFRWNGAGTGGPPTGLIVVQRPGSDRLCVEVGVGGLFQVTGKAGSNWRVGVYDPDDVPSLSGSANRWKELPQGGKVLDASEFHTSCSVPLSLGDSFGTLTLVAGTPPGSEQSQQVLSGVSLAGAQVATSNCATLTTAEQPEPEQIEPEPEQIEPEAEQDEPEKSSENEELKAEAVEVEDDKVKSAEAETKKLEAPRDEDDESDGGDLDASS